MEKRTEKFTQNPDKLMSNILYFIGNTSKFTLKTFNVEDEEGAMPAVLIFSCPTKAKSVCENGEIVLVSAKHIEPIMQELQELRQKVQNRDLEIESLTNQLQKNGN
jgi:hypothetical protein